MAIESIQVTSLIVLEVHNPKKLHDYVVKYRKARILNIQDMEYSVILA